MSMRYFTFYDEISCISFLLSVLDTLVLPLCVDLYWKQHMCYSMNHCLVSVCPVVEGEDGQLWQPGLLPLTQASCQSLSRATCDPAAQKRVSFLLINHFLSVWLRRNTTPASLQFSPFSLCFSLPPKSSPWALPRTDLGLLSVSCVKPTLFCS